MKGPVQRCLRRRCPVQRCLRRRCPVQRCLIERAQFSGACLKGPSSAVPAQAWVSLSTWHVAGRAFLPICPLVCGALLGCRTGPLGVLLHTWEGAGGALLGSWPAAGLVGRAALPTLPWSSVAL
ncbi:hypothetical protein NDU88_003349 [Pleurodeles waltl]|uniref:Uncharacterized protein n=1 Tax=Pleurodeles waltl TaxID=8319 RepID=A0AAV7WSJ0_PLEWA|nr:hypothetical protein NDU88_003349 [Pleurodeles waltl]